jgi:hypothetical protein
VSARRGRRFGRRLLVASGLGVSIAIPSITSMGTDRLEAANPIAFAMGASPPGGPHAAGDAEEIFAETIDIHCIDCHRGSGAEGGIDLRAVADVATLREVEPSLLLAVRDRLRARDMPPPRVHVGEDPAPSDRPGEEEYRQAVDVLGELLGARAATAGVPDVVLRRLNRHELGNAIEAVFGVRVDVSGLPADDVGHGFDHLGEVLATSPLLFEKLVDLAEEVARRVVFDPETAQPEVRVAKGSDLSGGRSRGAGRVLSTRGRVQATFDVPRPGRYRAEFLLGGQQAGDEAVRFELRRGPASVSRVDVPAPMDRPVTEGFEFEHADAAVELSASFLNDFYRKRTADDPGEDRNAFVAEIRLVGPLDPPQPGDLQRALAARLRDEDRRVAVARASRWLLERCWGRRIESEEALRLADRLIAATPTVASTEGGSSRAALMQTLVVYAIASPEFLFRIESPRSGVEPGSDGSVPLDGYAVAGRLAAFLKGGIPDEALIASARSGRLDTERGILREVERLLRQGGARSLGERFATQWLHIDGVERLEPDPDRFGEIPDALLADMREETVLVFEELVERDRPITDLFRQSSSWWTPELARHYGLDPVALGLDDSGFARVDLDETMLPQAGLGVLRHASILLATSNPTRTSPVKRGKWVMESLLDCPPPPAPPGAPQLPDPDEDRAEGESLRRMLEIHRQDPDCASCHVRMDAIGFALEPLDAVGRWRTVSDGHAVDAAAILPNGRRIDGPADLRDVIVEDPALLRSFGKHLMVYALGRGLEWRDEPVLDDLVRVLQARPTVRAAIEFIVLHDVFRRMPKTD